MAGVESHRANVQLALARLGVGWESWPDVVLDPRLEPAERLSSVVVLIATADGTPTPSEPRIQLVGSEDQTTDWIGRQRSPWEQLGRVRISWTPEAAGTAVRSVSEAGSYDDRRVALALRGARDVCGAGRADGDLIDGLVQCIAALDRVEEWAWRIKELRSLARRVLASSAPPDLLDLSLLVDGDGWAAPAREAAHLEPADEVAMLVRLLGDLGPRKPTKAWKSAVEEALQAPAPRRLLHRWIELAASTVIVPEWPGGRIGDCLGTLFVGTNTDVVRACVWATSVLRHEEWPAEPLGVLARRGAAHNGAPGFSEALSLKVAAAAVDTLIARDGSADRRVLAELLEDLQRRDLLKKVGAALDRRAQAAQRDVEIVRARAQVQRRKASPAPRKARAAMDSLIRKHLGPELRRLGFSGGPTTWRQVLASRVDVISVNGGLDHGTGENTLGLSYGTYLDAVHPEDEPRHLDRAKIRSEHLDVEVVHEGSFAGDPLGAEYLGAVVSCLRDVVVPFLDLLNEQAAMTALLEHDVGLPPGAHCMARLGSPSRSIVLGMLALEAGDRGTAVRHLERVWEWVRPSGKDDRSARDPQTEAHVTYWASVLGRARGLP